MRKSPFHRLGPFDWFGRFTGAGTPALGPINTVAPSNTGADGIVGTERTCSTGTWEGTGTITYAYQWLRAGAEISGATSNTYTLAEADIGASVRCLVSATDDEGTRSAASNAVLVSAVAGGPHTFDSSNETFDLTTATFDEAA